MSHSTNTSSDRRDALYAPCVSRRGKSSQKFEQVRKLFLESVEALAESPDELVGALNIGLERVFEQLVHQACEDVGVDVDVERLVGVWHCPRTSEGFGVVNFVFAARAVGGAATPSADHPEVAWLTRAEIAALGEKRLLRGTHIEPALDAFERGASAPVPAVVAASLLPG